MSGDALVELSKYVFELEDKLAKTEKQRYDMQLMLDNINNRVVNLEDSIKQIIEMLMVEE